VAYKEGTCEFCGKETRHLASTTFVSNYCIGCHKLLIGESQDAICEIQANKSFKKDAVKKPQHLLTRRYI